MLKYVLTEDQKKRLNNTDLEKWKYLDNNGYVALKERTLILKRNGLEISKIKKV